MSRDKAGKVGWWWVGSRPFWLLISLVLLIVPAFVYVYASVFMSAEEFWLLSIAALVVLGVCLILVWGVGKTVPMTRKGKAFWIAFLVPIITLCVWASPIGAVRSPGRIPGRPLGFLWGWDALALSGPAFVVGGLLALIAYFCTSGPPMGRRGKAAWIGFFVPVVPASGIMLPIYLGCTRGGYFQGWATSFATLYLVGPSILLGLLIAAIAFARTKNKDRDPLKCVGCGYSLVGLTGDKCPECGHTVSSTSPS